MKKANDENLMAGMAESDVPAERKEEAAELPDKEGSIPDIGQLNLPGHLEIRERVLNLEKVPDKAQMVLALRSFGLSYSHIGALCGGITINMVKKYLARYDPDNLCTVTSEDKRIITTQMMMSSAISAILHITPEKLKESSASDLASIAQKMVTAAEKIRELDKASEDGKEKMKQAMSVLEGDME